MSELYESKREVPNEVRKEAEERPHGTEAAEIRRLRDREDLETFKIPKMVEAPRQRELLHEREVEEERQRLEGLLDGVNPGYDPFVDNEFAYNCGACARAVELRLSGVDPFAKAGVDNIATAGEMEALTGKVQVRHTPEEILAHAEGQRVGYETIMGIDYVRGNGHWVNLVRGEAGVYILDGQCGRAWTLAEYVELYHDCVAVWDIGIERGGKPNEEGRGV